MKKLLLCASVIALFGANAEALTFLFNNSGNPHRNAMVVRIIRDGQLEDSGAVNHFQAWNKDISVYPAYTQTIEIRTPEGIQCPILHIDAHQTLAQANKKTFKFAYPEEGGGMRCTELYGQQPSPKPAK